ncbi:MAG: hypothetical protein L6Q99_14785 [Planctomycetes bacterium]|nr:hypothetical protein [Planctomycetota bacterium]
MNRVRLVVLVALVATFAFAFALELDAGAKGYMPLDHGIVFDGAWRILQGQVPFRDFTTPNGLVPIYLQAPFFAVLGPTWFAYVLHAALANGAFVLLVFALLRRFALALPWAFVYAAASAVTFAPPIGVPYMEQASFLFALAALVAALWARGESERPRRAALLWCASAVALAAAFASKQIPAGFALPLVLAIAACEAPGRRLRAFAWLGASGAAVVVLVALVAALAGVDWGLAYDYGWRLPQSEGVFKLRFVNTPAKFASRVTTILGDTGLVATSVGALTPLVALAALAKSTFGRAVDRVALGAFALAAALAWTCYVFVAFAGNQWQNGVPLVFASVGLVHAGLARLAAEGAASGALRTSARLVGVALAVGVVRDAWTFQRDVVDTRIVNDLVYSREAADAARSHLPEELAFLDWCLPTAAPIAARDFGELVRFLRESPDGFVFFGDATIVAALARKPSLAPCLWLHPGLTLPWPDDPAFPAFDARWAAPFRDGRARWLVVQGEESFTKRKWTDLPSLVALAAAATRPERRFGTFRVLDLGP